MAKGTVKATHSTNGAYWSFEWSTEATSTRGVTKVSYNIYRRGRTESPTWLATDCDIKIKYNGQEYTILDTGRRSPGSDTDNGTSFYNIKEKDGSFNVTHNSDGTGSFDVSISAYINPGTGWEHNCTASQTCSLDLNQAYTNCTSPTKITASGTVAPNGSITVSWSGQADGVGNPISAYRVYWRVSADGAYPSPSTEEYTGSQDFSAPASSGTITLSDIKDSQRGHKVTFGVWSLGTISGYSATSVRVGGSVTINSLPTAPTSVTVTPQKLPSFGGQVKLAATGGTDSDSSQSISYKYSTSASGNKTLLTDSTSLTVTSKTTFYIWANDGLEDSSSYKTVTVDINSKPTLSVSSAGTELESSNSPSGAKYIIAPTVTLTKGNNGTGNGTYTIRLRYKTTNSGATSTWSYKEIQTNAADLVKAINDVRIELGTIHESAGCYYSFSAIRIDDMGEESDEAYDTNIYYVCKIPSWESLYNTPSYSTITINNSSNYFSKVLAPTFTYDSGFDSLEFYIEDTRKAKISLSKSSSGKTILGKWENIDLPAGTYNIKGRLGKAETKYYSSIFDFKQMIKINNIQANNLSVAQVFKAFETGNTYNYSILNPFNKAYSSLTADVYKGYGIDSITTSFYAKIVYNGVSGTKQNLTIKSNTTSSTIYFDLNSTQLYNMLPSNIKSYQIHTATLEVGFTDVFGASTYDTEDLTVDFLMEPTMSNLSLKVNSYELNTWDYLKEGMPIRFTGIINSYSPSGSIEVLINRKRNNEESGYVPLGPASFLWLGTSMTAKPGTPNSHIYSNQLVITVGKITDLQYEVNFKIRVKEGDRSFESNPLYPNFIKVCGHSEQGFVTLNKAEYSSGEITRAASSLLVQYTNTHPGMLTSGTTSNYIASLTCKLQYRNISSATYSDTQIVDIGTNTLATYLQNSGKERTFSFTYPDNMDTFICRLKIETVQTVRHSSGEEITTRYPVYSNEQAVYNTVPTVSYRKNLLGVNTTNFEGYNNAILVVGEHSSKDKIYLVSTTGVRTVSVNGDLDGFVIDGGTW